MKNIIYFIIGLMLFTGCAPQPNTPEKSQIKCIAEIVHVEEATIKGYFGTAVGGITGGVIGYQFGGTKKDNQLGATVGAVGGAIIGSMFDKKNNAQKLTIRADREREIEAIVKKQERLFQVGDRVEFSMLNNEVTDVKLVDSSISISCGQFKPSSVAKQCNELAKAGGNKEESHQVYLGKSQGEFMLQFETFRAKDQIFVIHDNKVIFDSGCIGTGGWKQATIPYNGFSEELTIKVSPNCLENQPSTKWEFKVLCEEPIKKSISKVKPKIDSRELTGVMTERIYQDSSKTWKYKVVSKDGKENIYFSSDTKIMYKNDLISLNILNDKNVDVSSIKLIQRNYIKTQNTKDEARADNSPQPLSADDKPSPSSPPSVNSAESLF
jgi:outer membrane lipoprotein SlyB